MDVPDSDAKRIESLNALLSRTITIDSAIELLSREPWDSDLPLVTVSVSHIESELRRFLDGELNAQDVEHWANVFEARDDVAFADHIVEEIVFELANPTLDGPLTASSAELKIERLVTAIRTAGPEG